MKHFYILLGCIILTACGKKNTHDLTVNLNVEGLKKGNVYLYKREDTIAKMLDSVVVNGQENIQLYSPLSEPEMLYLVLDKNSKENTALGFFADKGVIDIKTSLKNFNFDAEINGSEPQKILEDYFKIVKKFNNKNLDLIKERFDALKNGDTLTANEKQDAINNLIKRKYLYTINFALMHKNSQVAPYLAISEIADANLKYLDTIQQALTPDIKNSLYGKMLANYITQRKGLTK